MLRTAANHRGSIVDETAPSLPGCLVRLMSFRFVRHLPARRDGAPNRTGLRAGVGQTSREETAGRAEGPDDATSLWR